MVHPATSEALPPGVEREIRRLRFADGAVERAFRQDYAQKARRQLRRIMIVLLAVQALQLLGAVLPTGDFAQPHAWLKGLVGPAVVAGLLWLTYSRHFPRFWQGCLGLFLLVQGLSLIQE